MSDGHAGALQYPGALHLGRRRHHDHRIDPLIAASLEQEWNIEDGDLLSAHLRLGEQPTLGFVHQRMHDRLEPCERRGVAQHPRPELRAVDLAIRRRAGKRGLDGSHGFAFVER